MIRRLLVVALLVWAVPAAAQSQIVKSVNLYNGGTGDGTNTTSTSYTHPNYSPAYLYTAGDWNPAPTVYFEATMAATAGGGTAYAELYNVTDTASVASSEVTTTSTTPTRLRSGAVTLTTAKQFKVRTKAQSGTTARVYAARLIFSQSGTIVATETVFDIGGEDSTTNTTYTNGTTSGRYYHDTAFLNGTVATYFESFLSPNVAGSTARVQLYDGSSAVSGSEVTATGATTDQRVRSSAITLSHGSTYQLQIVVDSNTARMRGSRIIILQTATPTKTVSFYAVKTSRTLANNVGATRTSKRLWDEDEWTVTDLDVYHEGWMATVAGVDTASMYLFNGTTDVGNIASQTASQTRVLSGELALTDDDEFDGQVQNNDGSSATFFGQFLRIDVDLAEVEEGGATPRLLMLGIGEP
jgi:hypothetical protein